MRVFIPVLAAFGPLRILLPQDAPPEAARSRFRPTRSLMPRLESIVAASPLPEGWSFVAGSRRGKKASIRISSLEEGPCEFHPPARRAQPCGFAYRAAAVDLSDPRYSVSQLEAEVHRSRSGSSPSRPPLRALSVDGMWPGEKSLSLLAARSKSQPREIGGGKVPKPLEGMDSAKSRAHRQRSRPRLCQESFRPPATSRSASLNTPFSSEEKRASKLSWAALSSSVCARPIIAVANLEAPGFLPRRAESQEALSLQDASLGSSASASFGRGLRPPALRQQPRLRLRSRGLRRIPWTI